MCGHIRDVIIYHKNSFRGSWATGGSEFGYIHYFGYWILQQLVLTTIQVVKMKHLCSGKWAVERLWGWTYWT